MNQAHTHGTKKQERKEGGEKEEGKKRKRRGERRQGKGEGEKRVSTHYFFSMQLKYRRNLNTQGNH